MSTPQSTPSAPLVLKSTEDHLTAHTQALANLTQILNSALDTNSPFHQQLAEQKEELQREVALWKKSYLDSERDRVKIVHELVTLQREQEALLRSGVGAAEKGRDGGHGFTAIVIDGDGAIVSCD